MDLYKIKKKKKYESTENSDDKNNRLEGNQITSINSSKKSHKTTVAYAQDWKQEAKLCFNRNW